MSTLHRDPHQLVYPCRDQVEHDYTLGWHRNCESEVGGAGGYRTVAAQDRYQDIDQGNSGAVGKTDLGLDS